MEHVEGKVAFITGGAGGIGFGMATVFVRNGMKVVIADLRQSQIDQVMQHFTSKDVHAIQLDVSDREAMSRAADEVERVFGKVHVVCNNAGVMGVETPDPSYQDWDWQLGVNLGGVINGVQTFVPRIMKHGEGGHIVNTSSLAGFNALSIGPIYSTTKFAVRGFTETLRWNLPPKGIGVSLLVPTMTKTGLAESEKTRPGKYSTSQDAPKINSEFAEIVKQHGMDPMQVGEEVLKAIRRNRFYIFLGTGHKAELREACDDFLAAVPEGEGDPLHEERRRQAWAKMKSYFEGA